MKKTLLVLSAVLIFCLAGLGTSFAHDSTFCGDSNKTTIKENGVNVEYNTVQLNDKRVSSNKIQLKDSVSTRKGVIDYVVENWHTDLDKDSTEYSNFANELLSLSQDNSREIEDYPDNYKVSKTLQSEKVVTIEERDGLIWTVTQTTTSVDEFTFKMADFGDEEGQGDFLLFFMSRSYINTEERVPVAIVPNNGTIHTQPSSQENVAIYGENLTAATPKASAVSKEFFKTSRSVAVNGEEVAVIAATMKKGGVDIIPALIILLILFSKIGIGIGILNKTQ